MSFTTKCSRVLQNSIPIILIEEKSLKVLNYNFRFLLAILGGFIIFSGCNKQPESIGLDLVDQNKLPVFDTTFSVCAYSIADDSVITDETSVNLLGSQYTENFGLTVASIYTHLRLVHIST